MKLTFGLPELDKMLKEMLYLNSLIVIAGHPGAGKTSLASKICYENAKLGNRCLYITFQEDKRKLFKIMKNLGIDLEYIEKEGLLKFLKLPITFVAIEKILDDINNQIARFRPKIIIIDSMNTFLKAAKEEEKRAYLQNYFYTLSSIIDGMVVLIAELPFGQERINLGDIEFVADAVLIMKHKIEHGLLVRTLELRKARGSPIIEAEIPFSIVQGYGIRLHVSPIIEELPKHEETIAPPCNLLEKTIGNTPIDYTIYISYPPDMRPGEVAPIIIALAVANKKRALVISYRYSSMAFKDLVINILEQFGYDGESYYNYISKYIDFIGINPFAFSLSELYQREIDLVTSRNYDIVIFHGIELVERALEPRYLHKLVNQLLYLKSKGKLVIRLGSEIHEETYRMNAAISDIVLKFEIPEYAQYKDCRLMIWARGNPRYYASCGEIIECVRESIEKIEKITISEGESHG
ncbi:MAG: AAA family ATPase [Desulfurococcales archaeon]|nr:AAA family ATPase [Desulfurococcales archaeon]MEB3789652.1 AAA family ATPase [Desulfurococcales archaeon]